MPKSVKLFLINIYMLYTKIYTNCTQHAVLCISLREVYCRKFDAIYYSNYKLWNIWNILRADWNYLKQESGFNYFVIIIPHHIAYIGYSVTMYDLQQTLPIIFKKMKHDE